MADNITQVLGFDAAQALDTLKLLDAGFSKFQTTLNSSAATFSVFNAGAGKTVSALLQITSHANQAADALNRLNTIKPPPSTPGGGLPALPAGNGSAATNLLTGSAAAGALNTLLGQTTTQANAAATAVAGVGTATAAAAPRANGFAISLETISRVIGTQLIVRSLNAIRSAVEDSFQGFINFDTAIKNIETISDEPIRNLGGQVRQLADDFNLPLLDVAKAKYEAVSNGFRSAAESGQLLAASAKFSKVGIASAAESVDLISTSLNAYGKSANEAETISAKLFKTIDLGRVVGSELANAFGRVAPIGKEIGATEDELLAAFSSITIGGVKASEAATQIRATLTALLKPSEEASAAFKKLGVETGEQLVRAKGFKGALDALIGTTDGSTASIAKLFPNVRALNGVLRETGTGATIFEDHLKEIQRASRDLLNQKFEIRIDSDAQRVSADLNKLKDFFTVELGARLVAFTSNTLSAVGGVKTLTTAISAFAGPISASIALLLAYNVGAGTVIAINKVLTTSFAQAGLAARVAAGGIGIFVAALAAVAAGQFIGEQINRALDASRLKAEKDSNDLLSFQRSQSEARATLEKIESDEKFKTLNNAVAAVRKAFFDQVSVAQEANKTLLENDKATLDKIVASREKFAQDLKRAAQQAETDIVDSKKRSNDIQAQLDDQRFNFQNKRFNDATQAFRDRQRAETLASEAANKLAGASKPEEKEAAQSAFQRAESFARQAISSAESSKNIAAQVQAERTLESILQKRINAEAQFRAARAADAKKLEAEAAKEEARVTRLKQLAKDFLENASIFQTKGPNKGDLLSKEQIDANIKTANEKLAQFKEEAFGKGAKFNLDDLFSFDKLEQRLNSSFTKGEVKDLFASDAALKKLRDQVQGAFDKAEILVGLAVDPSQLEGKTLKEQIDTVSTQLVEQQDSLNGLRQSEVARVSANEEIVAKIRLANAELAKSKTLTESFVTDFRSAFDNRLPGDAAKTQAQLEQLKQFQSEIGKAQVNPSFSTDQTKELQKRLLEFEKVAPFQAVFDVERLKNQFNILVQIVEKRRELQGLDQSGQTTQALDSANQQLNTATQRAAAAKIIADSEAAANTALQGGLAPANSLKSSLEGSEEASRKYADNMERAQRAAASTKAPAINPDTFGPPKALGGVVQHFASGGTAKGTDTIATMLSPQETIINARSSQKFFAQLQAIQAGVAPSFNSSGGSTTINVGDINVNGAGDPKTTAREVVNAIRREQRRGTSSLRK